MGWCSVHCPGGRNQQQDTHHAYVPELHSYRTRRQTMKFFRHLLAGALSAMVSATMAAEHSTLGTPPPKQSELPQTDQPVNAGSSPQQPIRIYAASAPCQAETVRRGGKVVELYWTNGPYGTRVTTNEVDHYVDLNLVVRTAGYQAGDCIKVKIHSDNDEDVAIGAKEIVIRGKVNESGVAYFEEPMRNYTVILR